MDDNSGEERAICLSPGAPVREAGCTKKSTGGETNQRVRGGDGWGKRARKRRSGEGGWWKETRLDQRKKWRMGGERQKSCSNRSNSENSHSPCHYFSLSALSLSHLPVVEDEKEKTPPSVAPVGSRCFSALAWFEFGFFCHVTIKRKILTFSNVISN